LGIGDREKKKFFLEGVVGRSLFYDSTVIKQYGDVVEPLIITSAGAINFSSWCST
jgi:hypothetical protein